jgi:3-isopropylmalate dehydrogenase
MNINLVLLPGDGIGPEVTAAAQTVLEAAAAKFGHAISAASCLIGGCAIDETGSALPDETLAAAREADAVLLGAVGGPKWDDPSAAVRPEQGLLGLRKGLGLFANLRPLTLHPALVAASPLKAEKLEGVDMLVVRELTGGIYFGQPRGRKEVNGEQAAFDTMIYSQSEVRRIAHVAFKAAQGRRKKVTSVDKANVLHSSRLWRQTVVEVSEDYPEVELEHVLVDAATMHLINRPASFDVIVAGNLFGDILTDEASVLSGSMGNLPSASIGDSTNRHGYPRGMYEPIHGSAPDIAGKGIANPIGAILSTALMLRYSFGLEAAARAIEQAVFGAIAAGNRTGDLAVGAGPALSTDEMTAAIVGFM